MQVVVIRKIVLMIFLGTGVSVIYKIITAPMDIGTFVGNLMFLALVLALLLHFIQGAYIIYLQYKGLYPREGHENMESVQSLIDHGYRRAAMYCYRKVTGASLKETVKYFENIASEKHS
jgi:hypothetical protein